MNVTLKEIILVVMTGCIPALLIQFNEGFIKLREFVSGAMVPNYLFFYFLLFFFLHVFLTSFCWLYGYKFSPEKQKKAKQKIIYIAEIGDSFLGIYRLASGLLFTIPIVWKYVERDTLTDLQFAGLVSYALLLLGGVISISSINSWAKSKL
ncbi:hypothetical protein VT06_16320 [Arsukibacterium sp. MJ3]|uniref:hypothetical protein n=1 Tax=Arsukibacterium sp. MJ3 TaxID=1632859 RepID=UPI0006274026|nr:hypothetical protein [Arsukibacterium sp. MJ3]KKO47576.1 hypothetical protein VT06_16320 [Arsukibacterium sp. MJ3]